MVLEVLGVSCSVYVCGGFNAIAVLSCLTQVIVQHRGWPSIFLLEDLQLVGNFYRVLWDVGRRAGAAMGRTFQRAELQEMHM